MRPEWAPQDGVLLAWPNAQTDWATNLEDAQRCYRGIIRQLLEDSRVLLLCPEEECCDEIRNTLNHPRLTAVTLAYNDTWARDFGPIAIDSDQGVKLLDFHFNAWGDKYNSDLDNQINSALFRNGLLSVKPEPIDFILEGGSIETDGAGTLLTTEHCLLSANRNGLSRDDVESHLKKYLNVNRVLWLSQGHLLGDDTNAHIDTLARFADAQTIVYMSCDREDDPHYEPLKAMKEELRSFKQMNGSPYRLIPIPLPMLIVNDGRVLPASYVNFLITNQQVLVPTYDDDHDTIAVERIASAFPNHHVTGIDCRPLIQQYGSLHCISMQLPESTVNWPS